MLQSQIRFLEKDKGGHSTLEKETGRYQILKSNVFLEKARVKTYCDDLEIKSTQPKE